MAIIDWDCDKCKHQDTDVCDDCSVILMDGCSCHINPPCSFCEGNLFEERCN